MIRGKFIYLELEFRIVKHVRLLMRDLELFLVS